MSDEHGQLGLIRLSGDLTTKSRRTRRRFQNQLLRNIRDALESAGVRYELRDEWGRLFVAASDPGVFDVISRVFGVASLSEVEATSEPRLESIVRVGEAAYADRVRGRSFAVRGRRAGQHGFSSRDINYELGAALDRYGHVDLDHPAVTVHVEVHEDRAYFFSERIEGPGGLPLGVEGHAVVLVSGGYDSAVAAWLMLKRGIALDYVFCNLAGSAYERAVLAVVKRLSDRWSYGTQPRIHVVDFGEVLDDLRENSRESYWQVSLKRLMYRAAERVARELAVPAIVTGESLGQVSSQTLSNLCAITDATAMPVLRPLLGFDKGEIIARSREIGTYELSEKVKEHCALVEQRPVTDASPETAHREESRLDPRILERAVADRRIIELRLRSATELILPYLYATEVPPGALVIDTRPPGAYRDWHYPGAERRDFWELSKRIRELDPDRVYVLYCDSGLQSVQLAEQMQREGIEAYSFKGGTRALRRHHETSRGTAAPRLSAKSGTTRRP